MARRRGLAPARLHLSGFRPALGFRFLSANDAVRRAPVTTSGRRIGVLGGSFDPPHEGHVHLCRLALTHLGLDEVWWLLTPQNPLKTDRKSSAIDDRLAACKRLVNDKRIRITALEAQLGSNLTVQTLEAMTQLFPGPQFVWLMGADNLASFHRWHGWRAIASALPLAVIDRPGYGIAALRSSAAQKLARSRRYSRRYSSGWRFIAGPENPLSSTQLRQQGRHTPAAKQPVV